jgi:hypothetical protein
MKEKVDIAVFMVAERQGRLRAPVRRLRTGPDDISEQLSVFA